jgi:HEAT repeat protein
MKVRTFSLCFLLAVVIALHFVGCEGDRPQRGGGTAKSEPRHRGGGPPREPRHRGGGPPREPPAPSVTKASFSPNGRRFFTDGLDGLRVWDVATARGTQRRISAPGGVRYSVVLPTGFSSDGRLALSQTYKASFSLSLWEVESGKEVRQLNLGDVQPLTVSGDGTLLAGNGPPGEIHLFRLPSGEAVRTLATGRRGTASDNWATAIFFSPDGKQLLADCSGFWLKLWDIDTGRLRWSVEGYEDQELFALSPDGRRALSGRRGGSLGPPFPLVLWDVASGTQLHRFIGHPCFPRAAAFTADGRTIVSADGSGTVKRWNAGTGELLWSLSTCPEGSWSEVAAFSPDGRLALSIDGCGQLKLWDALEGKLLRLVKGPPRGFPFPKDSSVAMALGDMLMSADVQIRRNAAEDLGKLGAEAVGLLAGALTDADATVRRQAADSLGLIGREAAPAEPALTRALGDREGLVSVAAATALCWMKRRDDRVVAALRKALRDRDPRVRREAVTMICGTFPEDILRDPATVASLRQALGDNENLVRVCAAAALWSAGSKDAVALVQAVRPALRDPDASVRDRTVSLLRKICADSREAAPLAAASLTEALRDRDNNVRIEAAWGLREHGTPARVIIPSMLEVLKDRDEEQRVRGYAAGVLGSFGPEAAEAIGPLVALLKERREGSPAAGGALAKIGPAALPAVRELLRDRDPHTRLAGASVCLQMGPGASGAALELAESLKDLTDSLGNDQRAYVALALGKIGPGAGPGVVPLLVAIVKNHQEDKVLRQECVYTLGALGPAAFDAIPVLADLQNDPAIAEQVVPALAKIKAAADRARRE